MLCCSQSRARNNMYIKLIFIAQEHLPISQIPVENGWHWIYFSRSNCTFLFYGIWHSKLIFVPQKHLTMDQIPFENGWPWKYFSRPKCTFSFHDIRHSKLIFIKQEHLTTTRSLFKIGDLENAVQCQIALDPFMTCDIGLYQPRGLLQVSVFLYFIKKWPIFYYKDQQSSQASGLCFITKISRALRPVAYVLLQWSAELSGQWPMFLSLKFSVELLNISCPATSICYCLLQVGTASLAPSFLSSCSLTVSYTGSTDGNIINTSTNTSINLIIRGK